jgi:hypothetical protein
MVERIASGDRPSRSRPEPARRVHSTTVGAPGRASKNSGRYHPVWRAHSPRASTEREGVLELVSSAPPSAVVTPGMPGAPRARGAVRMRACAGLRVHPASPPARRAGPRGRSARLQLRSALIAGRLAECAHRPRRRAHEEPVHGGEPVPARANAAHPSATTEGSVLGPEALLPQARGPTPGPGSRRRGLLESYPGALAGHAPGNREARERAGVSRARRPPRGARPESGHSVPARARRGWVST